MMQWIDGHPCPSCGAAPQHWEYHYPRGGSEKDSEIYRLRDCLDRIAKSPDEDAAHLRWLASDALKVTK